jgi:hypothetical protein
MTKKRKWIALLGVPICFAAILVVGAAKSYPVNSGGIVDPTCTSSLPCIEYDNNGTGAGMRGVSLAGNGMVGFTRFNATSTANAREGVFGNDQSTSGAFDAGVRGLSVRGVGVAGQSTSGDAVFGASTSLAGVHGFSTSNNGAFGDSIGAGASGVYGQNDGGGYGVAGRVTKFGNPAVLADAGATGSDALHAISEKGGGMFAAIGSGAQFEVPTFAAVSAKDISSPGAYAVSALSATGTALFGETNGSAATLILSQLSFGTGPLITAISPSFTTVMSLDNAGNMHAHSFTADLAATTGQKVVTYSPQASEPTIEDFSEAQLTDGSAYVHLETRFAAMMAPHANYLVFITPEGDNRGLYVTQKSPVGFAVRESQGGHSTLAFSYRIVAKPFGNNSPRLPNYAPRREPSPRRSKG